MTSKWDTIRQYSVSWYDDVPQKAFVGLNSRPVYTTKFPTLEECRSVLEEPVTLIQVTMNSSGNPPLIAPPRLNDDVKNFEYSFRHAIHLTVAPIIPRSVTRLYFTFAECDILRIPPTIPRTITDMEYSFYDTPLLSLPSIPKNVTNIARAFYRYGDIAAEPITGEMVFRAEIQDRSNYWYMFRNVQGPIIVYGDRDMCEAIVGNSGKASTDDVSWQPWYDPIPAVTNRGQGSYTTAEDMTRMVRNGCLAVDSYAPGRMVYNRGDIVREDEWTALVEAAQTIDPTVTMSTHYTNLNKIEKAFDDAL